MSSRIWQKNTKRNLTGGESNDRCYTPEYALDPLWSILNKFKGCRIWEAAAGQGHIVSYLKKKEYDVIGTEIYQGKEGFIVKYDQLQNFFNLTPQGDIHLTNPPYSIVFDWIEKCYDDRIPFALLIKVNHLGAAQLQVQAEKYGSEVILLDKRIDFRMPNTDFEDSHATFPVLWFTHGLEIGKEITYGKITTKPVQRNYKKKSYKEKI